MTSIAKGLRAASALGARSSAHYLLHQIGLRSGWTRRRTPVQSWDSIQLERQPESSENQYGTFFWDETDWQMPGHLPWSEAAREQAIQAADGLLAGVFPLFGVHRLDLGFPPDWHSFPPLAGGEEAPPVVADQHWTEYSLESLGADIKLLWEPSRFGWAFMLGRAYRWTGDGKYPAGFWQLFESWLASHQANAGPHWISAQEVALRLLAMAFARFCFGPALDDDQRQQLEKVIQLHAERIPATIAYSRAQRNNHLLSEAAGLLTAGLLFPHFAQSKRWVASGYEWFVAGLDDQIFDDGGYRQHSTNYGRLALELGLWVSRLCLLNGLSLPAKSKQALTRLTDWLSDMVESENGRVPNLGPNDGALLLPLTSCAFTDYRPTIQAARAILGGKAPFPAGKWDELTLWFGTEAAPQQIQRLPARNDHPAAGVFSLGVEGTHGFLRAAEFDSRPGHIDQLQLDLWRDGLNLALDPGTYLYNGEPPWDNRLAGAMVHNGPVIDQKEPMRRAGRFLWLDWSKAKLIEKSASPDGAIEMMTAEHDGYRSEGVMLRRLVLRAGENLLLVLDDVLGTGEHEVHLSWLLPQAKWTLVQNRVELELDKGQFQLQVGRGDGIHGLYSAGDLIGGSQVPGERPQWGWFSPSYALKEPALHWVSYWRGQLPLQIRSWWCFDGAQPDDLELRWDRGEPPLLRTVHFGGSTLRR